MLFPGINVKIVEKREKHQTALKQSYGIAHFGCSKSSKGHSSRQNRCYL